MNQNSDISQSANAPILLIPYMWIGDFVRCHSVTTLLRVTPENSPSNVAAIDQEAALCQLADIQSVAGQTSVDSVVIRL